MKQQPIKRQRRTFKQIKILLDEFSRANLSTKEFCIRHNISEVSFYKWRSRYADGSVENKNNFVVLKQDAVALHPPALFAEVNGIRIYQLVSASYLKEFL